MANYSISGYDTVAEAARVYELRMATARRTPAAIVEHLAMDAEVPSDCSDWGYAGDAERILSALTEALALVERVHAPYAGASR